MLTMSFSGIRKLPEGNLVAIFDRVSFSNNQGTFSCDEEALDIALRSGSFSPEDRDERLKAKEGFRVRKLDEAYIALPPHQRVYLPGDF